MTDTRCALNPAHAATHTCSCKVSAVAICSKCIAAHSQEKGQHTVSLLETQTERMCNGCAKTHAEIACGCSFPLELLCVGCHKSHMGKRGMHRAIPLQLAAEVGSKKDVERLQLYLSNLETVETVLQENVREIDECQAYLKSRFAEVHKEMEDALEGQLQQLNTLKEEILRGIKGSDVKNTLMRPSPPGDHLISLIWHSAHDYDPSTLRLFDFKHAKPQADLNALVGVQWRSRLDLSGRLSQSFSLIQPTDIQHFTSNASQPRPNLEDPISKSKHRLSLSVLPPIDLSCDPADQSNVSMWHTFVIGLLVLHICTTAGLFSCSLNLHCAAAEWLHDHLSAIANISLLHFVLTLCGATRGSFATAAVIFVRVIRAMHAVSGIAALRESTETTSAQLTAGVAALCLAAVDASWLVGELLAGVKRIVSR